MKRLISGLAIVPFFASVSLAAQPIPLSDGQLDAVTAGFDFVEIERQNTGVYGVWVNLPAPTCSTCYLVVTNTYFDNPSAPPAMVTQSQFGPTPFLGTGRP